VLGRVVRDAIQQHRLHRRVHDRNEPEFSRRSLGVCFEMTEEQREDQDGETEERERFADGAVNLMALTRTSWCVHDSDSCPEDARRTRALRLRFDVLTKTKQPELHRYWTARDRAANVRLFRLASEVLRAITERSDSDGDRLVLTAFDGTPVRTVPFGANEGPAVPAGESAASEVLL
jgi:hypothetical protein